MSELSPEEVHHEAEQLAAYLQRGGDVERWLTSKDLTPADSAAVLAATERE
jgi:hypothetical protein